MDRFNQIGHVCRDTKRMAIPLAIYVGSHMQLTRGAWIYSEAALLSADDPWKLIQSIDHMWGDRSASVWLQDGTIINVADIDATVVYVEYSMEACA